MRPNQNDIRRGIVMLWNVILSDAVKRGFRADYAPHVRLPRLPRILGTSSKVEKSRGVGMLTRVVYMSPANESGVNMCAASSPECRGACLGHSSGHLQFNSSKNSRLWKSALYLGAPRLWRALLDSEIESHIKSAHKQGLQAAIRPNGSTDLNLESSIASAHPEAKVYGYTKVYKKLASVAELDNASLTFSYSGRNWIESAAALNAGHNVAVCFAVKKDEPLPTQWRGAPVIDGDIHDARMLDTEGSIVGLRLKGNHNPRHYRPFVQIV